MLDYLLTKTSIIQRIHFAQQEMAAKYGGFVLFALLERENWPARWDVVVSASWVGEGVRTTIDRVFDTFERFLTPNDLLAISQVIVLKSEEPFVREVLSFMQVQHQNNPLFFKFSNQKFNGIEFRRGYVFQWNASASDVTQFAAA